EMAFNEEMVRRQRGQRDARAVVRHVLECEYEQLDRRTVDGIACEGFRTTDPTYANGFLGDVRVELWVDVDTYLPVRLETETLRDGTRFLTVSDQYEWDVAVDAREFEPVIPEGYTSPMAGPVQMPAMDEPSLIEGLQMLRDFGADTYPEALTMQGMVAQMSGFKERVMNMMRQGDREGMKAFMKKHYDIDLGDEKPSMEQLTQATMRITLKLQGPCLFYATLVQDRKDPAYHGKVVTPADAGLPLVRWRISESEYRVIFGDLHAETVDAQTLAELEAALPE
ncbi:MAG: hypothetical protein MI702_15265, partial [Chlorobiales bacterium]|nr:hypothetical protein [Chlorobiales bacterium]